MTRAHPGKNPGPRPVERPRPRSRAPAPALGLALATVALVTLRAQEAAAQTAQAAGIEPVAPDLGPMVRTMALVGAVLNVVPAGVGVDAPVSGTGPLRALIEWPMQVPLRWPGTHYVARYAALSMHRVVITPGLALGDQPGAQPGTGSVVTFHARAGYRLVFHPRARSLGAFVGAGTTVEFWPWVRPSVGAELGLHVGSCCDEAAAILTVTVRADVWFAGDDRARVAMLVGWGFY